jgi:fluoroquinolone resistance protein
VADRAAPLTTSTVRGEDWYARELTGETFEQVAFVDVDMTEVRTTGAVFDACTFRNVKLNASVHVDTAFSNCTFNGVTFFDTRLERCKLIGSVFDRCSFEIMRVEGGNWSFVELATADLRSATFRGVRLREADLTGAKLEGSTVRDCDLAAATLHRADLTGCDLRGSDLVGIDLSTVGLRQAIVTLPQAVVIVEAMGLDVRVD